MYFGSLVYVLGKKKNLYKAYGVGWSLFAVYTRIPVKMVQYCGNMMGNVLRIPSSIVIVIC